MTTHTPKCYWKNCLYLMALLALIWGMGYVNLGEFNLVVALAIAVAKMLLIVLFFMNQSGESRILQLSATVGVLWLFLMFTLTLSDYLSRGWDAMPIR
ncbi:MAG: cytochrome C oxidase subunit IV family protein [Chthoniobacterales bacterium]